MPSRPSRCVFRRAGGVCSRSASSRHLRRRFVPHARHDCGPQLGSTTIGIQTKEGVVLGVEKRVQSPLLESSSIEKIMEIDSHVGCAMSGLTADARTMVDHARVTAQVSAAIRMLDNLAAADLPTAGSCGALQEHNGCLLAIAQQADGTGTTHTTHRITPSRTTSQSRSRASRKQSETWQCDSESQQRMTRQ